MPKLVAKNLLSKMTLKDKDKERSSLLATSLNESHLTTTVNKKQNLSNLIVDDVTTNSSSKY